MLAVLGGFWIRKLGFASLSPSPKRIRFQPLIAISGLLLFSANRPGIAGPTPTTTRPRSEDSLDIGQETLPPDDLQTFPSDVDNVQRRMLLFICSAGNDTPKGVGFSLQALEVIRLRDLCNLLLLA